MRFIHTADFHLESSLTKNHDSYYSKERKKELLYNFERLVDYAMANYIDVILISGDLFDKNKISIKSMNLILELMSSTDIKFIYTTGNHDEYVFDNIENKPDNLYLGSDEWQILSIDNIDIHYINYNNISDNYLYNTLDCKKDKINIVVMHSNYYDWDLDINRLKNKNIDYLALGHIHKYQLNKLDDRGIYAYPGTPEGRGFDECGKKGFIILDVSNLVKTKFIPFARRELHDITVDITDKEIWNEIKKEIKLKINGINNTDMIRINLIGKYNFDLIKHIDILNQELNDLFYFSTVIDNSSLLIDSMMFENEISLKGEFIRGVIKSDLTEDEKNIIIEYGIKALMGEKI